MLPKTQPSFQRLFLWTLLTGLASQEKHNMNPPPTSSVPGQAGPENPSHEAQIRALYGQLLDSWNRRDAPGFAALFVDQGHCIGFDGSQMDGPAEIQAELSRIFADHVTARYVSQVRWVRFLTLKLRYCALSLGWYRRE
jgi:hypothetical protein